MRILVSGASGFIGKPLVQKLREEGREVVRLVRNKPASDAILWNPEKGIANHQQFEGFDAVIHLAGEPVFGWRWTKSKKDKILTSRILSTLFLSHLLSTAFRPPRVFLSPSAIGYYGECGEKLVEDETPKQSCTFLGGVCREWEKACATLEKRSVRVVHPRLGIVLGKGGGVLQAMRLPYLLGLGGKLGDGKQWVSWVALDDVLSAICFALTHPSLEGPFITASPNPVRQEEFSQVYASHLHRSARMHWPKWLLRLASGREADELFLQSVKAYPRKLLETGFQFQYSSLDSALTAVL